MRSVRIVLSGGLSLLIVAASIARGGEAAGQSPESGDCPCCHSTSSCPAPRCPDSSSRGISACQGSQIKLGGVTPAIIIQEEEEELLGLAAEPEADCCKKAGACDSKSDCCRKGTVASRPFGVELELEFSSLTMGKPCREKACTAQTCPGEKTTATLTAHTVQSCQKNCSAGCSAEGQCDRACGACAASHDQAAVCHDPAGCCTKGSCKTACPESAHAETRAHQHHGETAKALLELMERLGPSLLEGTEFEFAAPPAGLVPEFSARPLSIREQLVEHIRELEADGFEVECDASCPTSTGYPQVESFRCINHAPSMDDAAALADGQYVAASVEALREAAETLERTAANLERHNLYEPSDATRELAGNLRLEGRRMQQAYSEASAHESEMNSVRTGHPVDGLICTVSAPTSEMPLSATPLNFLCGFGLEESPRHLDPHEMKVLVEEFRLLTSRHARPKPRPDDLKALVEELRAMRESLGQGAEAEAHSPAMQR